MNYKGQEYHATLTMPDGALLAGNNYTYTVKVRNKVLEVSEATIAKWNDIDGGDVGADLRSKNQKPEPRQLPRRSRPFVRR